MSVARDSLDTSSSLFSSLLGDNPPPNAGQIPVVMINDYEETESDFEDLSEGERNVPIYKIYKTFSTEAYTHGSEYTTPLAIERFRRSTPVSSLASEQLIILDPCQKDELICLNVAFLRNQTPIDCGFLLENEDLPARLRQSLDKMPPKAEVPWVLVDEKAMRRWLKKVRGDPGFQPSENQLAVSTTERRKKKKTRHSSGMNSVDKELKNRAQKIVELSEKVKANESSAQTIATLQQNLLDAQNKLVAAEETKKSFEAKCTDLEAKYSTAYSEHAQLKKDFDTIVVEKEKLTQYLAEATAQKKELAEAKAKTNVDLEALQKEIALQHAHGFHKAIAQIQCLNPDVITEGVGVFKRIVDGKLVDESDDDEE
ncbi:hypothetical protein SESBI_41747 [Sesbania bispinosa]|nr:hypothetical protein SESBI_41747 [Sesbania bispinosa]